MNISKAAIHVLGLAFRMLPTTNDIPKYMLPAVYKSLIQILVGECVAEKRNEIVQLPHALEKIVS